MLKKNSLSASSRLPPRPARYTLTSVQGRASAADELTRMVRTAFDRLRTGLCVPFLLIAGCSSSAAYGTYRLKCEWSLVGICGPYSRTWLEDGSGEAVLPSITERSVSPDRRWMVMFDTPYPSTLHLLDVRRDVLRTIRTERYLWEESARWSPDGSGLAFLAGNGPTRLCVVSLSAEPELAWPQDDPRDAAELVVEWRDGTARIAAR